MPRPLGYVASPLEDRFDEKVEKHDADCPCCDGCWLWTGFVDKAGYARLRAGGRSSPVLYAHRYAYERFVGPVPEGLHLDHLCRTRHCVNPMHLEAVTNRENTLRGNAPMAELHRRGTCARGHPRSEAVLRRGTNRVVYCKACRREDRAAAAASR